MTVTLWMGLPPRPRSSLVSTLMARVSHIHSQVQCGTQARAAALGAGVPLLLSLQPAQSSAQRATALLLALSAMLVMGEDVDHILGNQVPDP